VNDLGWPTQGGIVVNPTPQEKRDQWCPDCKLPLIRNGACLECSPTLKPEDPKVSLAWYETIAKKTVETVLGLLGRLPLARRSVGVS
jgi:hypothetical protein